MLIYPTWKARCSGVQEFAVLSKLLNMEGIRNAIERVDQKVGTSTFGRVFRLEGSGHVSYQHRV